MRKKKTHDPSTAPPPAMFVGDEEPAVSRVPEPPEGPSLTPPKGMGAQVQAFVSLPPSDTPEPPSPARPTTDPYDSDGVNWKAVGWMAVLVLGIVSKIVEPMSPLSDQQEYLGICVLAVVVALIRGWMSLHDSDLAYTDRDSDGRMARLRNMLRRLFHVPVI